MNRRGFWVLVLCGLAPVPGFTAGFLDHKDGVPYRWDNTAVPMITYRTEPPGAAGEGDLSDSIDNAAAKVLVASAFAHWVGVSVADVSVAEGTDLTEVVDESNYEDYVLMDSLGAPRPASGVTSILFDRDGKIIDGLFGGCLAGLCPSDEILGVASAGDFDDTHMRIGAGIAVLNGKKDAASIVYEATITHELGHLFNLQHTQVNYEAYDSGDAVQYAVIPTMFPFLRSSAATSMINPKPDDAFSLAYLYPKANFSGTTGTITGSILRRNGEGVRGVNVICRSQADPLMDAVSWVSDQVLTGRGEYICGNLGAGNHTVFIEPIFLAINLYTPDPPFIVKEHYSGTSESWDPAVDKSVLTEAESIASVAARTGTPTPNINVILNEDGRLISKEAIHGTSTEFFPPLEYFITVPEGSTKVTFELTSEDPLKDLDIYGRCDGEFSLPIDSTALPLTSSGGDHQAEFTTSSEGGNEKVELDAESSPRLRACTYHLLILNYSMSSTPADYEFKAIVEGNPELVFTDLVRRNGSGGSGEMEQLVQKVAAKNENFEITSIVYTDTGVGDLSRVLNANLYEDTSANGRWDDGDTLIASAAEVDRAARKASFSGFRLGIAAGYERTLLVTYEFAGEAGFFFPWLWFLVPGAVPLFRRRRLRSALLPLALLALWGCSTAKPDYRTEIVSRSDVAATGLAYGSEISIRIDGQLSTCSNVTPHLLPGGAGGILPQCVEF